MRWQLARLPADTNKIVVFWATTYLGPVDEIGTVGFVFARSCGAGLTKAFHDANGQSASIISSLTLLVLYLVAGVVKLRVNVPVTYPCGGWRIQPEQSARSIAAIPSHSYSQVQKILQFMANLDQPDSPDGCRSSGLYSRSTLKRGCMQVFVVGLSR